METLRREFNQEDGQPEPIKEFQEGQEVTPEAVEIAVEAEKDGVERKPEHGGLLRSLAENKILKRVAALFLGSSAFLTGCGKSSVPNVEPGERFEVSAPAVAASKLEPSVTPAGSYRGDSATPSTVRAVPENPYTVPEPKAKVAPNPEDEARADARRAMEEEVEKLERIKEPIEDEWVKNVDGAIKIRRSIKPDHYYVKITGFEEYYEIDQAEFDRLGDFVNEQNRERRVAFWGAKKQNRFIDGKLKKGLKGDFEELLKKSVRNNRRKSREEDDFIYVRMAFGKKPETAQVPEKPAPVKEPIAETPVPEAKPETKELSDEAKSILASIETIRETRKKIEKKNASGVFDEVIRLYSDEKLSELESEVKNNDGNSDGLYNTKARVQRGLDEIKLIPLGRI